MDPKKLWSAINKIAPLNIKNAAIKKIFLTSKRDCLKSLKKSFEIVSDMVPKKVNMGKLLPKPWILTKVSTGLNVCNLLGWLWDS